MLATRILRTIFLLLVIASAPLFAQQDDSDEDDAPADSTAITQPLPQRGPEQTTPLRSVSDSTPASTHLGASGGRAMVIAHRLAKPITVDGVLDEDIWKYAPNTGLLQSDPAEGKPATERTDIWMAYDDDALYIAARCYDSHPELVSRNFGRRDGDLRSDWFWVGLDTYHDHRTGFYFSINPVGSIEDGVIHNDGETDESWDGIWERATRIDEKGWTVELRIPYAQLRFNHADTYVWGINFYREIKRKNETDWFTLVPKGEGGLVSRFADLVGISKIEPPTRLEVIPYAVAGTRMLQHAPNDPFITGNDPFYNIGGDIKSSIGSGLSLDATINPDFGQVEVDPAVLNLSANEIFFEEKRPFFIEGANIFNFGQGGANSNWNFGGSLPNFFYSRRIGRQPEGVPYHEGEVFSQIPPSTTILGAAKITGAIAEGWTLGVLNALTSREYEQTDSLGIKDENVIAPLANFSVVRTQREFNEGGQALGFIGTLTERNLDNPYLATIMNSNAESAGLDGWTFLDKDRVWVLTGWAGYTRVAGSRERITDLQLSPQRYYQQPDVSYLGVDTNATALTGWAGRVVLNKQSGNWTMNAALGITSPGFETNDLGFLSRSNYINGHTVFTYRWFRPDSMWQQKTVSLAVFGGFDFGGTPLNSAAMLFFNGELRNFWNVSGSAYYSPVTYDNRSTRGGPFMIGPGEYGGDIGVNTDTRRPVSFSAHTSASKTTEKGWSFSLSGGAEWRPNDHLELSFYPEFDRNLNAAQYVATISDPLASQTYGARYIFGDLVQSGISAEIRLDWSFTPTLSLQLYAQPYLASGTFQRLKELARPRSYYFNVYGQGNSTLTSEQGVYTLDPDGAGPAQAFQLGNPDYNYKSLRGTAVLRWEYRPGSTLYLVWTQSRENYEDPGTSLLHRDLGNLFRAPADNIFQLKATWWLNP